MQSAAAVTTAAPLGERTAARIPGLPLQRTPADQLPSSRISAAGLPSDGLPTTGLPAAGLRLAAPLSPAAGLRVAARIPAAARVRRPTASGPHTVGAGNHPTASAEPQRHLQRCGGLYPG